jgi:hypothetical protein
MTNSDPHVSAESASALTERLIQAAVDYEFGRIGGPAFTAARTAVEGAIGAPAQPVAWCGWHPKHGWALQTAGHDQQHAASLLMRTDIAGNHGWSVQPLYAAQPPAAPVETARSDGKTIGEFYGDPRPQSSAATEQATGRYEFPYNRTFQAIAAATSVYAGGVGVNVSVKAFQEAFNSFPDTLPLTEPQTASKSVKLCYVKRWRTLVELPEKYADEIVQALREPQGAGK